MNSGNRTVIKKCWRCEKKCIDGCSCSCHPFYVCSIHASECTTPMRCAYEEIRTLKEEIVKLRNLDVMCVRPHSKPRIAQFCADCMAGDRRYFQSMKG